MRIIQEDTDCLTAYEQVSIAFEVRSRLYLDEFGELVEKHVTPRIKDYDQIAAERPTVHASRQGLAIFSAFKSNTRVGGIMVARDLYDFEIVDGKMDVAVILDLRVTRALQRRGVGRLLFERALQWAQDNDCTELRVETQDTNVDACRFYERMGCRLLRFEENAYGPEIDEARLVWALKLNH